MKLAKEVALSAVAFLRMLVVVTSIVAWAEREWVGLVISLAVFVATTRLIGKLIDTPGKETIEALTAAVEGFSDREDGKVGVMEPKIH